MIEEEPKNLIVKIYRVLDKYIKNSSLHDVHPKSWTFK